MSSASDYRAYEDSVRAQDTTNLFKDKNWTYITDNSNGGVFNGQLQFDLNTLSSQSQWVDLSQAYIQFPVRVKISNNGSGSDTPPAALTSNIQTCLKNGYWNFVDSVQVVLDGSTIQTAQIFENIRVQYDVLTSWSKDTAQVYGTSLGFALDDFTSATTTLNNLDIAILAGSSSPLISTKGVVLSGPANPGILARQFEQNVSTTSEGSSQTILGANNAPIGKSQVAYKTGTAVAVGEDQYIQFVLATIRLKDISPALAAIPMSRNLKGFLYVNYNASSTVVTSSSSSTAFNTWSTTSLFGRCCPALITKTWQSATGTPSYKVDVEISGITSNTLTTAKPPITYARLIAPYYVANPSIDAALSMKKTFRYLERNVSTFNIAAGQNFTMTLSPGISNPRRVILFPMLTKVNTFDYNPLLSPFDTCPATTSPFAALRDVQILVGNSPMFQNPVTFDYDMFIQEVAQQGLEGGLDNEQASGLISQAQWESLYRFYTCDVGRRLDSEDGSSKSVIVQCTNATTCPMQVIAMILYEKECTIDTSLGRVSLGRVI